MRSDDLVPLLVPKRGVPSGPQTGFRQGVIVTWDQETAENTVLVAGAIMENLPILNTSEASLLAAGDVVGILTAGPTWAIMGRFTYPGTPEAVTSIKAITNRIQAAENIENGLRNSTAWGDLTGTAVGPSVTVPVGPGGRVLAFWSAEIGQTRDGGGFFQSVSKNSPHVGIEITGANVQAPSAFTALNYYLEILGGGTSQSWFQATAMHVYSGLNPGDTTLTMKYRHDGVTPSSDVAFQSRELAVFVL